MSGRLQPGDELDRWHADVDPWGYEQDPEDGRRKAMLLGAIPQREYRSVLDIGCGQGFVTRDLPGMHVTGVDVSAAAVAHAARLRSERLEFQVADIFTLPQDLGSRQFDLIIVTGVLYEQYIGRARTLVYLSVDRVLEPGGILISVHIDEWYTARFPYTLVAQQAYPYRQYHHRLEVYRK